MKTPLLSGYTFQPSTKSIDFSALSGFDIRDLFAVINLKTGDLIYAVGNPVLGYSSITGSVVTFEFNTTSMGAADPLIVLYENGDSASNTKLEAVRQEIVKLATAAGQASISTTLTSILSTLQAQVDFESAIWTDGTSYFVRREALNENTGAFTVTWTDASGTVVAAPSNVRPASSDNAIQLLTALFDVQTAGTGYSVGDQLSRVVAVNKAATPPTASSAIWINMTTGAVIAAPASANIAETDQNVVVTNAAVGAQADTAAANDTGTFSLIALMKRLLGKTPGLGAAVKALSWPVSISTDLDNLEPAGVASYGLSLPTGAKGLTGWISAVFNNTYNKTLYYAPSLFNGTLNGTTAGSNSVATPERSSGGAGAGSPSPFSKYIVQGRCDQSATLNIFARQDIGGTAIVIATEQIPAGTPFMRTYDICFRSYQAALTNTAAGNATAATLADGFKVI